MKNLSRLILALFAIQLLSVGIARAATTSSVIDQKNRICAVPDGGNDEHEGEGF